MQRFIRIVRGVTLGALCVFVLAEPARSERESSQDRKRITEQLAEAMRKKDRPAVEKWADQMALLLGGQAGQPEIADEYQPDSPAVRPLTEAECQAGFEKILQYVRKHKWWRIGLDPEKTGHLPREVATCIQACLAGYRAGVPSKESLLKEAVEAGDYLLWTQERAGTGVIPFPAYRGGQGAALQAADRFLKRVEQSGRLDEIVKNGWVFDDLTDGGLQFDNGECGVVLFELYEATQALRFLKGAKSTADWAAQKSCVTNWNYNSFSVYLLATAYRFTQEPRYLTAAREKARVGVLPGQLRSGKRLGRWADPHNARPAYHFIMVRGLVSLFAVLSPDDPDRELIGNSIRLAMLARNEEFVSRGVMNVDSSMEALMGFQALTREQKQAIGACRVDEAFAVLERYCVLRLRKGDMPCGVGVAGRYFESVVKD